MESNDKPPKAALRKDKPLSFLTRLLDQAAGKGQSVGKDGDPAADAFPLLWEWLTTIYVGKEKIKSPPSISITLAPDGVIVRVNDRDLASGVEVSCPHLMDCFHALEENLRCEKPNIKILGRKEPRLRTRQKQ